MAVYLRYYETDEQYQEERENDYFEPWVSLTDEVSGTIVERVDYNEPHLFKIEIKELRVLADVPASGGTIDKNDCQYVVNAVYSDMNKVDITASATVSGSLVVPASQIERRHSAGTLTLTATYDEFEATASAKVYQEAFIPSITAITLDNLTWVTDIPASGGTATKDNCTFNVTSHYDNGTSGNVTDEAVITGSLVVESSETMERHSAGTLTLTATYSGFSDNDSVTVYQEAFANYLTFNILSGGNIAFGAIPWESNSSTPLTIEYEINDGEWTSLTSTVWSWSTSVNTREDVVNYFSSKFSVNAGDVVKFRGNNQAYAFLVDGETYIDNFNAFLSTASFNVEGNIMSLIDKDNFNTLSALTAPATFAYLFSGCYNLISAENLLLPATTLSVGCYNEMFYDFIGDGVLDYGMNMSLTTAPELPATTLADFCYAYMFFGCTGLTTAPSSIGTSATTMASSACTHMFSRCSNLTTAPELPATTLASECYEGMFESCSSLTTAPELPATTLASECYRYMFQGCTSLTTAPELPATTLADICYQYMFGGCTNLTTAPELPATTLATICYNSMFSNCTSLTTAPELPATTLAQGCYRKMFEGCTSLTTAPSSIGTSATTMADSACTYMFWGCTSLTTAPELPATTLAGSCYSSMFSNCTNLTTAPELLATTLADYCYFNMFQGCTSLITAPTLSATTLGNWCCYNMFANCTSLTTAPELPATTLTDGCYYFMFSGCTSLTTAPELLATTLANYCYQGMFSGCTNLNYIKCLATTNITSSNTYNWVSGVQTNSGTFVKNANASSWTTGTSGIPNNWTIQDNT